VPILRPSAAPTARSGWPVAFVLLSLGMTWEQLAALKESGAIS